MEAVVAPVEKEGPSKKELNKLAKKEKKESYKSEGTVDKDVPLSPAVVASSTQVENASVLFSKGFEPRLSQALAEFFGDSIKFEEAKSATPHEPFVVSARGSISGDVNIARFLTRRVKAELCHLTDPWLSSQVDQWLDYVSASPDVLGVLELLNSHFADKTYTVGSSLSLADLVLHFFLSLSPKNVSIANQKIAEQYSRVSRWNSLIISHLNSGKSEKKGVSGKTTSASGKNTTAKAAAGSVKKETGPTDEGGSCPPLEDAVDGQVRLNLK